MNINEVGEDTRVPAGRLIEYMDQTSIVYRQLPAIALSLHATERFLKNLDNRMLRMEREIDEIKNQVQQNPVITTAATDAAVRTTLDNAVRRTPQRSVEMPIRFCEGSKLSQLTMSAAFFFPRKFLK